VAARACAYGVQSGIVDGMDVLAVRRAAGDAVAAARAGKGPFLLECKTYRFIGHSRSDARGYRTKDEEAEWQSRDPITRLGQQMIDARLAGAADLEAVEREVSAVLDDAVEFARNSPATTPEMALEDAYA
jgi:TPP-dependent pyruvate/acetoin dehydrogenase alpha subunit